MSDPESLGENPHSGASSVHSNCGGDTSEESNCNTGQATKSTKSSRGPPPPIPAKPPRVYALAKGNRSHSSGSGKSSAGNSTSDDSSEGNYSNVRSLKGGFSKKNSDVHYKADAEIYENIPFVTSERASKSPSPEQKQQVKMDSNSAKSDNNPLSGTKKRAQSPEKESANNHTHHQMKNVEIFISDFDNPEMEDAGENRDNLNENDNLIPLINDLLPHHHQHGSKSPNNINNGAMGEDGNDETCITGCSWEMDDDDDGTDCSSSSGCMDRVNKAPGMITTPTTLRKATVGCGMAAASSISADSSCVDTQLKDQIVVVKLAAKVVQCPSVSPTSASPRPPPPPPPIPSYPDSSTATDSSSASHHPSGNEKGKAQSKLSMLDFQEDEDPGKDGNEPGLEESSTSELYQNMVVAHGLMIEREMGDRDVMTVQKIVDRQELVGNASSNKSKTKSTKNHFMFPARPLTEGKGVDDLSDDDDGEDDDKHSYQNIIVKKGKFSVSTKKSNTKSSCDPSVHSVPFTESSNINSMESTSSAGNGYSTRILELDSPSSEAPVPVVHAVINLPPRKVSLIKERRRNRLENMSYQKASRINERMVADFKTAGNDRPSSLSIRDGKVMSVTSNNCSELQSGDGTAAEPGSIIGKVKIGFGLNKAKSSLRKSKSVVTNQVERAKKKVGSWYHRRVRTPVEHMGAEFGRTRSNQVDIASSLDIGDGSGGGGARGGRRRSRSHEGRSLHSVTSTGSEFVEGLGSQQNLEEDVGDPSGSAYSNVAFDRRKSQSIDLLSPTRDEETLEENEGSEEEDSFKTKVCLLNLLCLPFTRFYTDFFKKQKYTIPIVPVSLFSFFKYLF